LKEKIKMIRLALQTETDWSIVVSTNAGQAEHFAAQELQRYIEQICGARMPVVEDTAKGPNIRIGQRIDLNNMMELPEPIQGFDGYSIAITESAITVAGDNPRGVIYGAYDLLERLGCRWYFPTLDPADPEVVPQNPDLMLDTGAWSEAAQVELRWFNGAAFFNEMVEDRQLAEIDWAMKNRYNGVSDHGTAARGDSRGTL
jgi:alpha-glucuronidase